MWEAIASFVSNLFGGGGGEVLELGAAPGAMDVAGAVAPAAAGAAGGVAGTSGASSFLPWAMLALQGANVGSQMFAGSGTSGGTAMPAMPAPPAGQGVPANVRASLANQQASGLSGASPDFIANMLGMTPEELDKMMRRGGM